MQANSSPYLDADEVVMTVATFVGLLSQPDPAHGGVRFGDSVIFCTSPELRNAARAGDLVSVVAQWKGNRWWMHAITVVTRAKQLVFDAGATVPATAPSLQIVESKPGAGSSAIDGSPPANNPLVSPADVLVPVPRPEACVPSVSEQKTKSADGFSFSSSASKRGVSAAPFRAAPFRPAPGAAFVRPATNPVAVAPTAAVRQHTVPTLSPVATPVATPVVLISSPRSAFSAGGASDDAVAVSHGVAASPANRSAFSGATRGAPLAARPSSASQGQDDLVERRGTFAGHDRAALLKSWCLPDPRDNSDLPDIPF